VHLQSGALTFDGRRAGRTGTVTVKNPWGATQVMVLDSQGQTVVPATGSGTRSIDAQPGGA
jgi:hypothetical protein